MRAEFAEGNALLEEALGEPVRTAAYPYGAYTPAVMTAAAGAGLHATVTTESTLATHRSDRHALPRVTILRNDTLLDFVFMFWTGRRVMAWIGTGLRFADRRWPRRAPRSGLQQESSRPVEALCERP